DAARVPLLKAASEAGDYHLAVAAMRPYLIAANLEIAADSEQGPQDDVEVISQESPAEDTGRVFTKLPAKDREEISRLLGIALERKKSPAQALAYLRRAYRLEADPATKAQINGQVQQIRFAQRRQEANRARRPQIHSELAQQNVVRPRLPERPVASPPAPSGRVQKGVDQ